MLRTHSSNLAEQLSGDERRVGAIGELAAGISRACFEPQDVMQEQIKTLLARAAREPALLSAEQRATKAEGYARHVLYADPAGRFTILSIVWGPRQFSPPHAHHTWCGYAVYEGELEETLFAWNPASSVAEPLRTQPRGTGYSCFAQSGLDQIHRLGNSGARPAISIHVYGVERDRVATHVNRWVEAAK